MLTVKPLVLLFFFNEVGSPSWLRMGHINHACGFESDGQLIRLDLFIGKKRRIRMVVHQVII
jgi:hypothetical protein